jgi:hypothetical protein
VYDDILFIATLVLDASSQVVSPNALRFIKAKPGCDLTEVIQDTPLLSFNLIER